MANIGDISAKRNAAAKQTDIRVANLKQQFMNGDKTALELCHAMAFHNGI